MRVSYRQILTGIILFIIVLLSVKTANAQTISPLTASVDRNTIAGNETVSLTVSISGSFLNAPKPELPSLDSFQITGTSTSNQISIINGEMNVITTYVYRLQPTRSGELVIDSIRANIDGQTYSTAPITVQVKAEYSANQGTPSSSDANNDSPQELNGQDYFVKAEVDKTNPYVGEQLTYTFSFFHAVELYDQPYYTSPSFTGFWNESQSSSNTYQTVAGSRVYNVSELQTILFPTTAGTLNIEPAKLSIPASFFNSRVDLQTDEINIEVKPLPGGAPDNFSGAVGQFTIMQEIDMPQATVNETLIQKVTLQGSGNIGSLPDPLWQEMENWRSFESKATTQTNIENGLLSGSRIYERLLVPSQEGSFQIPAIEYSYFDPASSEYHSISAEPITINVLPAVADTTPAAAGVQRENVKQTGSDIRYLKSAAQDFDDIQEKLPQQQLYWLAWLVPVFVLTGNFIWQKRQHELQNNLSLVRSSKARRNAKKSISRAKKEKQDQYSASNQILLAYLSDKLDQPVAGLTHEALMRVLLEKGLDQQQGDQVLDSLMTSDMGRYAPASSQSQTASLLDNLSQLIDQLEKSLK